MIVTDFACSVQAYVEHFAGLVFPRPPVCPHCRACGKCIGHGFYLRKALDQTQVYLVWIKRWYCKACQRTLSALPSFLLRFRHYVLEVIEQVVVARFELGASWRQIRQGCTRRGAPSDRSIKRWCSSFAKQAARWWAAVQGELAQHDSGSPALNPLGEAVNIQDAPRALLEAAVYLLAWAKTEWAELAEYGLNDRLRFLWQWGHAQGVERLV